MNVAVATSLDTDLDPDSPTLFRALGDAGVSAQLCRWDDESVRWNDFDLTVIRSTWNYPSRRTEFLEWASTIERLENPFDAVSYSSDKHYLADLEAKGLRIIPSHFCDVGETPEFFAGDFVVKPCVGAGSNDVTRYHENEHDRARLHVKALHDAGRDALIQPYIHSVDTLGERALIFINGHYEHAMAKAAMLNVSAVERTFSWRQTRMTLVDGEDDAVAFGEKVLATKGFSTLLYARVDLVAMLGGWAVMELELVEPSLFLLHHEPAAHALAAAIAAR